MDPDRIARKQNCDGKQSENGLKGNVTRHKACLVAQDYSEKYGWWEDDYEVFVPVAKPTTLQRILTIAWLKGMIVKHYDVETA